MHDDDDFGSCFLWEERRERNSDLEKRLLSSMSLLDALLSSSSLSNGAVYLYLLVLVFVCFFFTDVCFCAAFYF